MSLKSLNRKRVELDTEQVDAVDVRWMQKELKEYGIDFAIRKSKTTPEKYDIFFKTRDYAQLEVALQECLAADPKEKGKLPLRFRLQNAVEQAKDNALENVRSMKVREEKEI